MSTTSTHLMHNLFTWLPLLISAVSLMVALASIWFFVQKSASTVAINRLKGEISDAQADIADVRDRFSRFQKREGMRVARAEKTSQADLQAEAERILAAAGGVPGQPGQPGGPSHDKAALYARARSIRGH